MTSTKNMKKNMMRVSHSNRMLLSLFPHVHKLECFIYTFVSAILANFKQAQDSRGVIMLSNLSVEIVLLGSL